jgi:hypothetical protein
MKALLKKFFADRGIRSILIGSAVLAIGFTIGWSHTDKTFNPAPIIIFGAGVPSFVFLMYWLFRNNA